MTGPTDREGAWATATLHRSLQLVRTREGRLLAATAAGLYLFAALLVGKMLVFGPTGSTGVTTIYLASGQPWWLFPMYVVLAPNAVLELPVFAVTAMILVSAGIGVGMGVAGVLALRLLRWRRQPLASPTALGSVAGLTPALIALLTLGACCSTTAAATAGIGVVANATGTTTDTLLVNTWFLSIFQLAVLWVALVAQERLIVVYSALLDPTRTLEPAEPLPRPDRRSIAMGGARVLLLAAAITWSLSMLASWAVVGPSTSSGAQWADWVLLVQVPALAAGVVAISPAAVLRAGSARWMRWGNPLVRCVLIVSGAVLLVGVPAPLASGAFHGFGNELLGGLGVPASHGGVVVPGFSASALAARWGLQMVPLGALTLGLGLFPSRVARTFTFRGIHPAASGAPTVPAAAPAPDWPGASTSAKASPENA
jgi:hypothetical protein